MSANNPITLATNYQQAIAATADHYAVMVAFVKAQMHPGIDYGTIPGTSSKPVLIKAWSGEAL